MARTVLGAGGFFRIPTQRQAREEEWQRRRPAAMRELEAENIQLRKQYGEKLSGWEAARKRQREDIGAAYEEATEQQMGQERRAIGYLRELESRAKKWPSRRDLRTEREMAAGTRGQIRELKRRYRLMGLTAPTTEAADIAKIRRRGEETLADFKARVKRESQQARQSRLYDIGLRLAEAERDRSVFMRRDWAQADIPMRPIEPEYRDIRDVREQFYGGAPEEGGATPFLTMKGVKRKRTKKVKPMTFVRSGGGEAKKKPKREQLGRTKEAREKRAAKEMRRRINRLRRQAAARMGKDILPGMGFGELDREDLW